MEFDQTDHDCIVRTAAQVKEHERRLAAINGQLELLNVGQDDIKVSLGEVRESVSGLKGRLATIAAAATAITSAVVSCVVVIVNAT